MASIFRYILFCCLIFSRYSIFAQYEAPKDPTRLLIDTTWKVDRRRLNNKDIQRDSLYTFLNYAKIPVDNLSVITKDKHKIPFTWTELRDPRIRISIIFQPGFPPISFQYSPADSDSSCIVFTGIPDINVPERYCFKITLKK